VGKQEEDKGSKTKINAHTPTFGMEQRHSSSQLLGEYKACSIGEALQAVLCILSPSLQV
jgi:hypothetical protein